MEVKNAPPPQSVIVICLSITVIFHFQDYGRKGNCSSDFDIFLTFSLSSELKRLSWKLSEIVTSTGSYECPEKRDHQLGIYLKIFAKCCMYTSTQGFNSTGPLLMYQIYIYIYKYILYLEIPNASKFSCYSGKTRFFQMAPNIFGLRRVSRMHTFSSFGSFRDVKIVKPSLACFLKLCSCAMFACGCAMFACGYAVLARDQTHFLHSTSCCLFVE